MVLAAVCGLVMSLFFWSTGVEKIVTGKNDFAMLYAGAKLVGGADLYHAPTVMRVKAEAAREYDPSRQYTRLPYLAAILWPLGRLPYAWAYWVFQAASLAALIAFLRLWPGDRRFAFLAICCSAPVAAVFIEGQDVLFLLVWIAVALRWRDARPFAAGLVLALCAAKFHLFIHVPLVVAAQRRWRMGAGAMAGAAALAAVSFAVGGPAWPARFLATISSPSIAATEATMPNLHGLLVGLPSRGFWEPLLAAACGGLVWFVARRSGFDLAFAAALIAGLLTSVHSYANDCALLIPAALIMLRTDAPPMRAAAAVILLPLWYCLPPMGPPASRVLPAAMLVLLAVLAYAVATGCDTRTENGVLSRRGLLAGKV